MALPTLGGNNGQASAINNRGQIVGISETTVPDSGCPASKPGKIISPVFWDKGEVRSLPTLAGDPDGFVQGINNRGQVVGFTRFPGAPIERAVDRAFLWEDGKLSYLDRLIAPRSGWELDEALSINDRGQIVGSGIFRYRSRGFLLTPRAAAR